MVNALDTTDPATGQFGATVPIDSVASLNVFRSPFLAEYGRFTAAVVVVDTKRGGEKWHGELNDPTPELRLRSRHIRGVRGFTPRVSFSGPLIRKRLYLFQSAEYRLNKLPVFALPFPENETWRESCASSMPVSRTV
jgi:outer membrane receptor for ferrienterochelin and colicin